MTLRLSYNQVFSSDLSKLLKFLFKLYGKRNGLCLSSLDRRMNFLHLGIGDLSDAIRKGYSKQILAIALARIFSRIVCVIDIFNNHVYHFPLIKALAEKYGKKLCAYCQHQVCECIYSCRNEPTITRINRQRLKWGLRDWQQHLDSVYGPVNRTKGIEVLLTRLQKEVLEVLSVEMNAPYDNISLDQIEMEFARELADTLAWLLAVASYYDIDLRSAVEERYGSGCWSCKHFPCSCNQFSLRPIDWKSIAC